VPGPTLIERNRALHRMLVDGVTVDPARASDRDRWRWKIAGVDRVGAVRTLYGVVLRAGSVTDRLGEVRLPVLAVAGAEDKSFGPERVRTMVKRLPESQFRLIQDAGHAAAIEQPVLVTGLLRDFLGRSAPDSAPDDSPPRHGLSVERKPAPGGSSA
jgi:pimeloyl-ACP methyl ester carboxylesterase